MDAVRNGVLFDVEADLGLGWRGRRLQQRAEFLVDVPERAIVQEEGLIDFGQGNLIRARLSAAGYQELSRVQLIEPTFQFGDRKIVWSVPAFADRQVFARNGKELICASLAAKP